MIFDCESLSFILSCELGHILHSSASNNVSCLPVPCCLHVPCSLRVSCCLNVPLLPECAPVPANPMHQTWDCAECRPTSAAPGRQAGGTAAGLANTHPAPWGGVAGGPIPRDADNWASGSPGK